MEYVCKVGTPAGEVVEQTFTAPDESVVLTEKDTLEGGEVLPGLKLSVRQVFAEFPSEEPGTSKKPPRKNGKKT